MFPEILTERFSGADVLDEARRHLSHGFLLPTGAGSLAWQSFVIISIVRSDFGSSPWLKSLRSQAPRTFVKTLLHILLKAALHSLHSLHSLNFDEQRRRTRNRAALHSLHLSLALMASPSWPYPSASVPTCRVGGR